MEQVKHRIVHKMDRLSRKNYNDFSNRTSYIYRNIRPTIFSNVYNIGDFQYKVKQAIYHGEYLYRNNL